MEDDHFTWILGGENLVKIVGKNQKPLPNDSSQPSFAAEGNESALWHELQQLNQLQSVIDPSVDIPRDTFEKENDFVQLILKIEGDKFTKELFSLLFDIVIIIFFF